MQVLGNALTEEGKAQSRVQDREQTGLSDPHQTQNSVGKQACNQVKCLLFNLSPSSSVSRKAGKVEALRQCEGGSYTLDAFPLGLVCMAILPATQEGETGRWWHLDQPGTSSKSLSQNERLKSGLGDGSASKVLMAQHEDQSSITSTYIKPVMGQLQSQHGGGRDKQISGAPWPA